MEEEIIRRPRVRPAATGRGRAGRARAWLVAGAVVAAFAAWCSSALAQLPDGRVYERVTPLDKNGATVGSLGLPSTTASPIVAGSGALSYSTFTNTLPDVAGGEAQSMALFQPYAFTRSTGGAWSYRALLPPNPLVGMTPLIPGAEARGDQLLAIAPDQSAWVTSGFYGMTPTTFADMQQQPNLILSTASGANTVITPLYTPAANTYQGSFVGALYAPFFVGASTTPMYGHVLYTADAGYAVSGSDPAIPANVLNGTDYGLYDYTSGAVHQVAIQPGAAPGTPFPDGIGAAGSNPTGTVAVSADGSKIVFGATSGSPTNTLTNQLFLRENSGAANASTVPVSVTNPTTLNAAPAWDANCHLDQNTNGASSTAQATLVDTNTDASLVFFTSKCELTNTSNTGGADAYSDLYVYNTTAAPVDGLASQQTLDLTVDGGDANGADVQSVLGASSDGSYVYFTAHGNLAAGAVNGNLNLYVWHADGSASGTIKFLGNLGVAPTEALVAPDGSDITILSSQQLTAFNNNGQREAYVYAATGSAPLCAPCVNGITPTTGIPAPSTTAVNPLVIAANGTEIFFQTADALSAADANAVSDVYEWNAATDLVSLISSGAASSLAATLLGASPDGTDVYFQSTDKLVPPAMTSLAPDSSNGAADVFDARVDGISPPAPSSALPECAAASTWSCQPAASAAPALTAPNSSAGVNVSTTVSRTIAPVGGSGGHAVTASIARVGRAALRRFARTGVVSLDVRVSGATTVRIVATIVIRRHGRNHRVRVGSATHRMARAGQAHVRIRLSKQARRGLRGHHTLRVTLKVTTSGHTRTITLRLKK